jgi:hypothetical protein
MSMSLQSPDDFRIEVSGWGLDNSFFVETTELHWTTGGEKHVQLHRALQGGTMIFVRLLASDPASGSVPVAYRIRSVMPMDCHGRCQMRLEQLRPRPKESLARKYASNVSEESRRECDVHEFSELQREEILR